jgi:hypothetical protein
MPRLRQYYTHLISKRKHEFASWLNSYREFYDDVDKVRNSLQSGKKLQDDETYTNTTFEGGDSPFQAFGRKLLYSSNNGVAARGMSNPPKELPGLLMADGPFVSHLAELISDPLDPQKFEAFETRWNEVSRTIFKSSNPLLVNRVLSAATTRVSTTVGSLRKS